MAGSGSGFNPVVGPMSSQAAAGGINNAQPGISAMGSAGKGGASLNPIPYANYDLGSNVSGVLPGPPISNFNPQQFGEISAVVPPNAQPGIPPLGDIRPDVINPRVGFEPAPIEGAGGFTPSFSDAGKGGASLDPIPYANYDLGSNVSGVLPNTQPQGGTFNAVAPPNAQSPQYAPMAPQSGFNVNQASAAGSASDLMNMMGGGPQPTSSNAQSVQGTQQTPMARQSGFNVNQASAGALQQSLQGTQQAMGYQPGNIAAAQYRPAELGAAGQVAGADLGAYTNPYEDQVVQQSLRDLSGAQEKSLNQMGAQATAANAFGGSRQGIAEAETRKAYGDQATNMVTGLRSSGFQNAQNLAGQDIARQMQVNAANQAARNQAGQFNVGNIMNAQQQNIANQMSGNQARLGAAAQLGGLGQQAFNTGQTIQQNQAQQGLMQQGLQQALIDAARGQYAGYTGAPNQALSAPLAALGVTPTPQSTTSSRQPGLFDYLSLGATAAGASDARLKTDVTPAGNIGGFNFYNWKWNDEGKRIADPKQPTYGVMADEVQATHPHLVKRGKDGYLRVNYRELMGEIA